MASTVIRVIVSIDTEEDNWVPTSRGITVRNIAELPVLHRTFEDMGIRPTYFTNYQVTTDRSAAAIIRELHQSGSAEIGAHLHPWNTPPESTPSTMLLNLPPALQQQKIAVVSEALANVIDRSPSVFRAGRFGVGASTIRALIANGYAVDSSVTPFHSWSDYDDGPSHVGAPLGMYRVDGSREPRVDTGGPLVEAPISAGFHRYHPATWMRIQKVIDNPTARHLHVAGILARLAVARRVILSPEPHSADDLKGLARGLVEGRSKFLHVFWHSPSMLAGLTPFCRTKADVGAMMRRFFDLLDDVQRYATVEFATLSETVRALAV